MPPDPKPTFFVDASLGGYIVPQALRDAGADVIAHDERFPQGTKDEEWLTEAGRQGWIVLTKDDRIRYRALERKALETARVGAFVFSGKNLTGQQIGAAYVAALPRMRKLFQEKPRPFVAVVTASGAVRLLNKK